MSGICVYNDTFVLLCCREPPGSSVLFYSDQMIFLIFLKLQNDFKEAVEPGFDVTVKT